MTRPLRIELAGGVYHVTSRGDRRENIYFCDADRRAWLELLGKVCERFNWMCHAWCQMSNHYHIVVETVEGNLSQGMRQLNGVYTQHINSAYQRVGHVYQGRYKGILVEKESYLLELARYVVLNPVRAGMVDDPQQWPWSSYAAMTGEKQAPPWLQTDWILGQFNRNRDQAVMGYVDFVRAGAGMPSVWERLRGQVYLGSDAFLQRIQALSDKTSLAEIPRTQRRPLAQPLTYYRESIADPKAAMAAAYATGDYTMRQIADAFGVHYATVSRALKQHRGQVLQSSIEVRDCKT